MKSEIPTSTTTAPVAITTALLPLSPLSGEEVVPVLVGATGVVAVGVAPGDWGRPGESGLPVGPEPSADGAAPIAGSGDPSANTAVAAPATALDLHERRRRNARPAYRSDASGCSIAGVSGACL